jgi:hypothetical protein
VRSTDLGDLYFEKTFAISVTNVNEAPTISDIADQTIAANSDTGALSFTIGDPDAGASLQVSGSSSNTTLVPDANISFGGSGANRTVTVTPASGQSGSVTITITVSDGTLSASDTFTLTVIHPPVVTTTTEALIYSEPNVATVIDPELTVTDPICTILFGATVSITEYYQDGEDVLTFTDTDEITGGWDSVTGTLTLTGEASVAAYEAALRTVTYTDSSASPSVLTRTVTFTARDGAPVDNTGSATRDITIQVVGEEPIVTQHPTAQSVAVGETATFTAAATGDPTPTVRWQVSKNNGKAWNNLVDGKGGVSGANTTTLTLSNVSLSLSGYLYRAVFTNEYGTAQTDAALLTIIGQQVGATDLSVTKTGEVAPVEAGVLPETTWTIVVNNLGSETATDVTLTDFFPGTTRVLEVRADDMRTSIEEGKVTVRIGDLDPGDEVTIEIDLELKKEPKKETTISNRATVTSTTFDTDTSNNTTTASVTIMPAIGGLTMQLAYWLPRDQPSGSAGLYWAARRRHAPRLVFG